MAKMYLMCGCSGAGKTTFSKEFAKEHGLKYLGIDDFYASYNGDECDRSNSFDIWMEFWRTIHETEMKNIDCIIDTNALTICDRTQFIDWFPTFEHHLIYIETDQELRRKNNMSRKRHVPEKEMDKMARIIEVPSWETDSKWNSITVVRNIDNVFMEPMVLSRNQL